MSNFGPQAGPSARLRPPTLTVPQGRIIARYPTYDLAQRAVDFLSDNRLPVQAVTIVGTDLRVVERVTGRLTYGRVAVQGVMSGAWFGLLIGILLSLSSAAPEGGVATAILFGAGFGLLFAVISYASTRGRRDFTSRSEIVAGEYQILCADALVSAATELLARLPSAGPGVDLPPPPYPQPPQQYPAPPQHPTPPPASGPWVQGSPSAPGTQQWPPVTVATPQDGPAAPAAPPAPPSWPPAPGESGAAPAPAPDVPRGPTYSEMIDKQKRERAEKEAAERAAAARARAEQAERERAEQAPPQPGPPEQAPAEPAPQPRADDQR